RGGRTRRFAPRPVATIAAANPPAASATSTNRPSPRRIEPSSKSEPDTSLPPALRTQTRAQKHRGGGLSEAAAPGCQPWLGQYVGVDAVVSQPGRVRQAKRP